jgi:GT2 family glycosyltransferase
MDCDVGVVVVTYNSYSKLGKFFIKVLKSLIEMDVKGLNVVIAIVDNNSRDETTEVIQDHLDGARVNYKVIGAERNMGLPAAYNLGAMALKNCRYLLFMNDDVILGKNTVRKLVKVLKNDNTIGAVQPLIVHLDGHIEHGFDIGLSGFVLPTIKPLLKGLNERNVVAGCCIMVPTGAFFGAGMFRGELFWGYDDVDFCWRLHNHGYRSIVTTETHVRHYGSASWGKENPLKTYLGVRNWIACATLNIGYPMIPLWIIAVLLTLFSMLLYMIKHSNWKDVLYTIKAIKNSVKFLRLLSNPSKRGFMNISILTDARAIPLINKLVRRWLGLEKEFVKA